MAKLTKQELEDSMDDMISEVCSVIDHAMGELSGCTVDPSIPSTSPRARKCTLAVFDVLRKYDFIRKEMER